MKKLLIILALLVLSTGCALIRHQPRMNQTSKKWQKENERFINCMIENQYYIQYKPHTKACWKCARRNK